MNLRSLDLNLLLVFDAVYNERHISKAATRLHLSQPTVSNALGRLRERLNDPLFERSAQGMTPTARAKALAAPIRQALDLLERGLRLDNEFDYAASDREFVIAAEDYGESVILPRFIDWLSKVAPSIRIRVRPGSGTQLRGELRDGSVDLALNYFALQEVGYQSICVMTETLLTLSRRDHPGMADKLNLETYLGHPHVVVAPLTSAMPMIDLALSKRGVQRQIAVVVPHFLSMPMMVRSTKMLCTLPLRLEVL